MLRTGHKYTREKEKVFGFYLHDWNKDDLWPPNPTLAADGLAANANGAGAGVGAGAGAGFDAKPLIVTEESESATRGVSAPPFLANKRGRIVKLAAKPTSLAKNSFRDGSWVTGNERELTGTCGTNKIASERRERDFGCKPFFP